MNTQGTDGGSVTVALPFHSGMTTEIARRYFIGQRVLDGAHTEIGHRWSNMVEFFQNYARSEGPEQRMNLLVSIIRTVLEIRAMRRGLPMPELSRPQILLTFNPQLAA